MPFSCSIVLSVAVLVPSGYWSADPTSPKRKGSNLLWSLMIAADETLILYQLYFLLLLKSSGPNSPV